MSLSKLEIHATFYLLIKDFYKNPVYNCENLEAFLLRARIIMSILTTSVENYTQDSHQCSEAREKEINLQTLERSSKISMFREDMFVYTLKI